MSYLYFLQDSRVVFGMWLSVKQFWSFFMFVQHFCNWEIVGLFPSQGEPPRLYLSQPICQGTP